MWVLKGMTNFTGVPPFTIGSRILAPEFSIEDHLSRREKQKQQRMRADLCCVEELSVRLHTASVVVLRAQKSPKGSIDFTAVIRWRRAPIRARRLQTERGEQMTSTIVKHTIEVAGRKTSLSLEDAFWQSLKNIARNRRTTLRDLVAKIYSDRTHGNLSSAVRLFVLNHYKERADASVQSALASNTLQPGLAQLNGVP